MCLVAMQSGESLLHGCAVFGQSELLKELVAHYNLDINQHDHVRFRFFFSTICVLTVPIANKDLMHYEEHIFITSHVLHKLLQCIYYRMVILPYTWPHERDTLTL